MDNLNSSIDTTLKSDTTFNKEQILEQIRLEEARRVAKINQFPTTLDEAKKIKSTFWKTQPVPKLGEKVCRFAKINDIEVNEIQYQLPSSLCWSIIDMTNDEDLNEIGSFLAKHYNPTLNKNFNTQYPSDFLKWSICDTKPENLEEICLAIRVKKNNNIAAFIAGIPTYLQVERNKLKVLETNYLCIHTKLRKTGLCNILIKELVRLGTIKGYQQGYFNSYRYISSPFYNTKIHNRVLSVSTLLKSGFVKLPEQGLNKNEGPILTEKSLRKSLKLPEKCADNFIEMTEDHVEEAFRLYEKYNGRFSVCNIYSFDQFKRIFLSKFMTTYVLIEDDKVIDFISYYSLPLIVLKDKSVIKQAHLFYYTANLETPYRLVKNILIVARNKGNNLFSALDIMENQDFFLDLIFEKGFNVINYNFYNWKCPKLKNTQIASISF